MRFQSNSPEHTKQIAAQFATTLTGGEVILLEGELGVGKTTFVQGFAVVLGYEGPVRSPTFTLVNIYPTTHSTIKKIVHVDLYRLSREQDLQVLALEEWMNQTDSVLLVEWPQEFAIFQNTDCIKISIETLDETLRAITILLPRHAELLRPS